MVLVNNEFRPMAGLRNPHTQSVLNSSRLRGYLVACKSRELSLAQKEWIMECGQGARLIGYFSRRPENRAGLAVLMHGWEGSANSNYMLSTGARLFEQGFNVFRLNLRDHGDSHHLNPGLFHSCRLDEVIGALGDMQRRTGVSSWGIAGFSLGGNFALRVALHGPGRGLGVRRCVAVCPVVNPAHVLKSMEDGPTFYENYYNRKWARSLRKKQACFPDRYDYEEWHRLRNMRERTRYLATRYYGYRTLEDYFEGYSIDGNRLEPLAVESSILTAMDDPITPVGDVHGLPDNPRLEIRVTKNGGHCGYLKNWKLESWAEDFILNRLSGPEGSEATGTK